MPYLMALAAVAGLIVIAGNSAQAQTADSLDQSEFPQITAQPVDQTVPIGSSVTLSVQASNANGYQWLDNGVSLDGQTNNLLTIASAGIGDVGLYSCNVFNGAVSVPTLAANVCVYATSSSGVVAKSSGIAAKSSALAGSGVMQQSMTGGGPITVYGMPYAGGGSSGGCPGQYAGYVIYSKPVSQGWGWAPIAGMAHTVTDTNRTDTKVQYFGAYGDYGCAQTTVSIPNPTFSPVYQFAIYFPNHVPTNAYPMVLLNGFNQ